jgi:hypothetical protein
MKKAVSLDDIVEYMEFQNDEMASYLKKWTWELISVRGEEFRAAEDEDDLDDYPEWQQEEIRNARDVLESDDYIALPSKFDIHEYGIMEDFCCSVEDDAVRADLLEAIRGRGAFRCFKSRIHAHRIEKRWYSFRDEAFLEIAREWCERNGIPYTETKKVE